LSCSDEDLPIWLPVVKRYKAKKKEARGRKPEKLELSECVEVILELLETNPAVIIIDGLDECDHTRRQGLLDVLRTIIKDANNVVQVFVSSRDDHDLVH
jgi:enolase